ncbi:hypothetical protein M378DRAFT_75140 [Amanita muscaria Koide BX008]|uniref:Xylanolytic transcriptional activator regulatory domain-containing protein n=1 Tax=Amanita muscaria (strain Koide BX008) TaxID=946122 RepID=A0A0C2WXC8_AMAMK|nr:hypothetical protein M378DRAFT_75140 [Amanita muscaria Koide BX008]
MSSTGNRYENAQKRRRIPGACDVCKKKKGDSGERGGRPCTNCETTGHECTHRATTRRTYTGLSYVDNLEMRLEKMETILAKVFPGVDLNTDLEHLVATLPPDAANSPAFPSSSESPEPSTPIPRNDEDDGTATEDTDGVTFRLHKLKLDPSEHPYFGKSSGFQLIQTAIDIKREYMEYVTGESGKMPFKARKRQEFWRLEPWEKTIMDEVPVKDASSMEYPDPDLLPSLVDNYFKEINIIYPLLHRPTFERQIAEGLHLKDTMFGYTVLLVCAIGAKYSEDPRVFIKGSNSTRSAGHKWFAQVNSGKPFFSEKPTLHELQMHVLCIAFAKSSNPMYPGWWIQAGVAMRMALEVGAHRRRLRKDGRQTVEDELWKRAFWNLFAIDNIMSAISGRPCSLHEEDYDQEYPAECDDEFWEHPDPSRCFDQPENKVSYMAYYTCFLRLVKILAKVMRYVYSVRRSTTMVERAVFKSDQQAIAELDSAMNEWMDCIPDHLRWNPNTENLLFLKQSASLHAMYYQVQIFIHRPFIPSPRNPSAITFPSLAICTNAARSCCLMLDAFIRLKQMPFPGIQAISSTAALVLLVNVLNAKRMGIVTNYRRDMELFHKVVDMLGCCEKRWGSAGRHKDILIELASFNDLGGCPEEANIHAHGGTSLRDQSQQPCLKALLGSSTAQDKIGVSRNVTFEGNIGPVHEFNYLLPRYSAELGQLPVYQSVGFSPPIAVGGNPIQYSDIPLAKGELSGDSMFVQGFVPQGNVYHQGQAPTVGAGGMYQNQVIEPEPMWFGTQEANQDALGIPITDWPDQARLTEILEMMDIDNMGDWLNGNGSE